MDKLVRTIEVPLARKIVADAGLYLAEKKDIDALAKVAADAYQDYPLHTWFAGGKYNEKTTELLMRTLLKTMTEDAVIYADSEEMNGFAVWLPFNFKGVRVPSFFMNGGISLILHAGPALIKRLLTYENYAIQQKEAQTDHFDWYLYNLSVKKEAQGKGVASKLLRPMLRFCDDERMAAYLETNKKKNVSLYEHFGFELKNEEKIPGTEVFHYCMLRNPRPQAPI